jgi:hypothetical protein
MPLVREEGEGGVLLVGSRSAKREGTWKSEKIKRGR